MGIRRRITWLVRKLIPQGKVAERTIKSGIWVSALNVGDRGLQLIMMIVLARVLTPADFGLMGIALLTLGAMRQFSELAEAALIQQSQENVDSYLDTTWSLEIGRGLTMATICFFGAPYIASFFGEPRALELLQAIALAPLLYGLRNPAIIYFKKGLEFHKQFAYRMSGSMTNASIAIAYALIFQSVWALVLGYIAKEAMQMIVSYLMLDYRPRPRFDVPSATELIGYGKWITASSFLYFLYNKGDDAIVGRLLDASALGFYQMAYEFSNAPATEVTSIISSVMFPAFSQVQDDPERLRVAYYRTLQVTSFVAFPMAFGIAVVAPSFIEAFLGDAWLPMVTVMQILAAYGLFRSIGVTFSPVWKAIGRPDYITKLSFLRVVLMAIFIYPATMTFGVEGTALLIVGISIFPQIPIDIHLTVKSIESTYTRMLRELSYPLTASTLMATAVLLVETRLSVPWIMVEFFVLVGVGVIAYIVAAVLIWTLFDWQIQRNIRTIVKTVRG
ncbi:lipopolysaccharide biosynthesis protein [Halalkalicoccus salilacus]|uniref:lipopolysaccharide biosynthesis protein n=1 Tax=Halalkalicoccus sp. GCM10025704 TaxID=3252662 RepID=UPI00360F4552